MTHALPSIAALKAQAKRLRASLDAAGHGIGHSEALEAVARQHGFRDWNTLSAQARSNLPHPPVRLGETVSGMYLGQRFTGRVVGVSDLLAADRFRVTVKFDQPVDVVTFESFSAYRQRVTCVVDGTGVSPQKTSDGRPHMKLDLASEQEITGRR